MGRPRRRNNKSHKREIYGQIGIPIEPRDNEITIITNAISICIPTTDHVPSKIQTYVMENLRKQKISSEEFAGMEQRSECGRKITVFVYFNSKDTVEKFLKNPSRSLDGRRCQVQQATVNNTKSNKKSNKNYHGASAITEAMSEMDLEKISAPTNLL